MKVYLVSEFDGDGSYIHGVFATEQLAKEYAKKLDAEDTEGWSSFSYREEEVRNEI